MAPPTPKNKSTLPNNSIAFSSKAAIIHTMVFKLSLEINQINISHSSHCSFLKVLYNVSQIGKKLKLTSSLLHSFSFPNFSSCSNAFKKMTSLYSSILHLRQQINCVMVPSSLMEFIGIVTSSALLVNQSSLLVYLSSLLVNSLSLRWPTSLLNYSTQKCTQQYFKLKT